jgi:hypothetical protein
MISDLQMCNISSIWYLEAYEVQIAFSDISFNSITDHYHKVLTPSKYTISLISSYLQDQTNLINFAYRYVT